MMCLRNNPWRRGVVAAASIWPMVSFAVHLDRKMVTDYCWATERRCVVCNRVALFLDPATMKSSAEINKRHSFSLWCMWCIALPCMKCHCRCQHPTDIIQLLCVQSICNRFGTFPSQKRPRTSPVTEISSKPATTNGDQSRHETQQMFCPLYSDRLIREPWLSFEFRRSMRYGNGKKFKNVWNTNET